MAAERSHRAPLEPETRSDRLIAAAVLLAAAVVIFWNLGGRPLYEPDEGRYAEIARAMVDTGDWLVPRLSGVPYLDKPPLLYWLEAAGMTLLGENEWGVRVLPACVGWLGVALTLLLGRAMFSLRVGSAAAALLASSILYSAVARALLTDGILTTALLGAFLSFWQVWRGRRGALALWLCLTAAFLAKGPVGPFLFAGAAGPLWLLHPDRPPLRSFRPVSGPLVFAGLAAPWFVYVERVLPGAAAYFFLNQNLEGLVASGVHHARPWYYAVPFVLGGTLPWSLVAPWGAHRVWRDARQGCAATALLLLWAGVVVALFTISVSKLVTYYLPMYPAGALLVARGLSGAEGRRGAAWTLAAAAIALPSGGVLALTHEFGTSGTLLAALLLLGAGLLGAAWLLPRRGVAAAALAHLAVFGVVLAVGLHGLGPVEQQRSVKALLVRPELSQCSGLLSASFPPGMGEFYLGRPVAHLGVPRYHSAGRALGPGGSFIEWEELGSWLRDQARPCVLADRSRLDRLREADPSLQVVARNEEYAVLAREDPGGPN